MIDPALDAASDQIRSAETVIPMVKAFFDEATFITSYMVWDAGTKRAAIIDSALDYDHASGRTATVAADRIVAYVTDNGLGVDWLLETHVRADHLSAGAWAGRSGLDARSTAGFRHPVPNLCRPCPRRIGVRQAVRGWRPFRHRPPQGHCPPCAGSYRA